ncbi:hypothetical protein U9M48_029573 [Paspalum notatum var. saurae]|uniref:DUF6598 domain-containing protein n=1 Tax=Paspalum notatum var. saurae TaxID=547442 RepID=A0AAQ3TZR7_PASNO
MHRLSSALRFPLCFMASATTSLWLPALSRRVFPIMMSPICNPLPRLCVIHDTIPPVNRVFRLPRGPRNMATISRAEGDEFSIPYRRVSVSSADVIGLPLDNNEKRGAILDVIAGDDTTDKDACWNTSEVIYTEHDTWVQTAKHAGSDGDERRETKDHREIIVSDDEEYTVDTILAKSRHCDGSIYRGMDTWWKQMYNIVDRNETRLQAMALSYPTDCIIHDGICVRHQPRCMLQILSLELEKIPVDGGFVELYGYIAVRDDLDPLLNFIVNISRDEPIIVEQPDMGSQIHRPKLQSRPRGVTCAADRNINQKSIRFTSSSSLATTANLLISDHIFVFLKSRPSPPVAMGCDNWYQRHRSLAWVVCSGGSP